MIIDKETSHICNDDPTRFKDETICRARIINIKLK